MRRVVFGKNNSGTFLIPYFDVLIAYIRFSTRYGNAIIKWGDGTSVDVTPYRYIDYVAVGGGGQGVYIAYKNYSSPYNGDVSIVCKQGLKDVYSLALDTYVSNNKQNKINIQNFGTFIKQFPNLYSFVIEIYGVNTADQVPVIKGNLIDIPDSVERVAIGTTNILNAINDTFIDINAISPTSKLKHFHRRNVINSINNIKFSGDLAKIPISCNFFSVELAATGSSTSYTGKTWATDFDTLYIPLRLNTSELHALIHDIRINVTNPKGGKLLAIGGIRTSSSDADVTALESMGITVKIQTSDVLNLPLASDLLDTSIYLNHATMVGTANYTGGALNISTGNYAYIPAKSSLDFGFNSLKFGCKVKFNAVTGYKGIIGRSVYGNSPGRYAFYLDAGNIVALTQLILGSNIINSTSIAPYNDGNWHTIECVCNRTTGKQMLYIDGVLINTVNFTPSSNYIETNARFAIGSYNDNTGNGLLAGSELNGAIKDVFVNHF